MLWGRAPHPISFRQWLAWKSDFTYQLLKFSLQDQQKTLTFSLRFTVDTPLYFSSNHVFISFHPLVFFTHALNQIQFITLLK